MTRNVTIQSAAAELAAICAGAGRTVVMLHAGVADRRMWSDVIDRLSEHCHALAYDRRGFGETETPNEAFCHIDDLRAVIARTGGEPPVLIGCSQGGRIAIDYALAHPGAVAGLVLVATSITGAPSGEPYPPPIPEIMTELDDAEARGDLDAVNRIEAHLWLDGPLAPEGRVGGAQRDLFLDMNGIALLHPELTHEQNCPPAIDCLAEIAAPTLVICGDLDFPHIQQRSLMLADTIPGARLAMMSGCAHLPSLEQPDVLADAVKHFLAALP